MANMNTTTTTLNGINIHSGNVLTSATGGCLVSYASGTATWADRSHIDDIKDYIDFVLELMDIDLNFERFSKMTIDEKKAMIREMKINKIID